MRFRQFSRASLHLGPASPLSPGIGATGHASGSALKATYIYIFVAVFVREGNGTPLQYSCPENPMDGGAWWATAHGVAKSLTRLNNFTSLFPFMHWRRKWQPTPVFFPGESQGHGSLTGCRLWGRTESDTTEGTQQQQQQLPLYWLDPAPGSQSINEIGFLGIT